MSLSVRLDKLHLEVKRNIWLKYFYVFNRLGLAAGFLPSGFVKIMGERFTSLSNNHPMGNYLEALHHTGYYYTFIGVLQVGAALLLLIPRTALLGALIYFPIILNICILSLSVRFEGSLVSSPLMVLANLYLLCWNYDKLKFILPFNPTLDISAPSIEPDKKFPFKFFVGVAATVVLLVLFITNVHEIMPRNTLSDCKQQCADSENPEACNNFCDSIHQAGKPLNKALDDYEKAKKK